MFKLRPNIRSASKMIFRAAFSSRSPIYPQSEFGQTTCDSCKSQVFFARPTTVTQAWLDGKMRSTFRSIPPGAGLCFPENPAAYLLRRLRMSGKGSDCGSALLHAGPPRRRSHWWWRFLWSVCAANPAGEKRSRNERVPTCLSLEPVFPPMRRRASSLLSRRSFFN